MPCVHSTHETIVSGCNHFHGTIHGSQTFLCGLHIYSELQASCLDTPLVWQILLQLEHRNANPVLVLPMYLWYGRFLFSWGIVMRIQSFGLANVPLVWQDLFELGHRDAFFQSRPCLQLNRL